MTAGYSCVHRKTVTGNWMRKGYGHLILGCRAVWKELELPFCLQGCALCLYNSTEPLRFPFLGFEQVWHDKVVTEGRQLKSVIASITLNFKPQGFPYLMWAFCPPAVGNRCREGRFSQDGALNHRAEGALSGPSCWQDDCRPCRRNLQLPSEETRWADCSCDPAYLGLAEWGQGKRGISIRILKCLT